jgi:hypothetical protein
MYLNIVYIRKIIYIVKLKKSIIKIEGVASHSEIPAVDCIALVVLLPGGDAQGQRESIEIERERVGWMESETRPSSLLQGSSSC